MSKPCWKPRALPPGRDRGRSSRRRLLRSSGEALLAGRRLAFHYRSEVAEAPAYREVVPYGLLYGHRVYLVAAFPGPRSR